MSKNRTQEIENARPSAVGLAVSLGKFISGTRLATGFVGAGKVIIRPIPYLSFVWAELTSVATLNPLVNDS